MITELKHVFEGTLRGFATESRTKDGQQYNVDVMVLDSGMDTFRINLKRVDADELKNALETGMKLKVETLIRGFSSGLGVAYLRLLPDTK